MYNKDLINRLVLFIQSKNGIADKEQLTRETKASFSLTRDRSIYYCSDFAIRFCKAVSKNFSNTVLSLSALQKYDDRPFVVCIVTEQANHLLLSNTTFLQKISHSSQELRVDNIRGSFNGSDIIRSFEGITNEPMNFEFLFTSHENYSFEENLERLVEATNNIMPTGKRFEPSIKQIECIMSSPQRAIDFLESAEFDVLAKDLQKRVEAVEAEIIIAAFINNVNLRGRIIEYLITSADNLRDTLIDALRESTPLPKFFTDDKLGDYEREFETYNTATDIKTKILFLSSNPKGYNIDKLLSFLSTNNSVYLIYVVAIDENEEISTQLCSMFNNQLLNGTRIIKHWAGRNSRGVTQYDGTALEDIITKFDKGIDEKEAKLFIERCLAQ